MKDEQPVTLITAFFDIGRKDYNVAPRNVQAYLEYFAFWARMRNPLVVYTSPDLVEEVLNVRGRFGLRDLTFVQVVSNVFDIERDLYEKMEDISQDSWFQDFRLLPKAPSGVAAYSYLMLLKSWFVQNAVSRSLTTGTSVWIDFGFNHGGLAYTHSPDFDFEWTTSLTEYQNKVVIFAMDEYDSRPIFEIVRRLSDYLMGAPIIVPDHLAEEFWQLNRQSMLTLVRMGLIDDDQLVMLMSLRERPDLFEVRRSEWFKPLQDVCGREFTMAPEVRRPAMLRFCRSLVHWGRRQRNIVRTVTRLYFNLSRGQK